MNETMTVEERIVAKFLEKLRSDQSIPQEVFTRIQALCKERRLADVQAILSALREGIRDHAKNSTT